MKAPDDKQIAFLFVSHPTRENELRWHARLTFPPGATAETTLALRVTGGDGAPVQEGVFEFAGRQLAVANGAASLTYAQFIEGKHSVALWLHRPGKPPIPGGPTFG